MLISTYVTEVAAVVHHLLATITDLLAGTRMVVGVSQPFSHHEISQ